MSALESLDAVIEATELKGVSPERIKQFFEPRSVVVVGATERTLYSQCAVQNAATYNGATLHLVNRRGVPVLGYPAVTSCQEIGQPVDTAFIHVPAVAVADAMEDAYAAGIKNIVLLSSGFSETGPEGRAEQERLAQWARERDVLILGPNHVGFLNLAQNISVFALPAPFSLKGSMAVLSQSGAIAMEVAKFAEAQGAGMSHLITLGNEAMLTAADALSYVIDCPQTKSILMFLEEIKNPQLFAQMARRAVQAGKPLIIYKAGVTEVARKSAAAHTGAFVGDDRVTDAIFRELGIIRVYSLEDLVITGKLAGALGPVNVDGVGVISASGGSNDIVADLAEGCGVPLAEFAQQTKDEIVDIVPDNFITAQNPFDLTGSSVRDRTLWGSVTKIIGKDPEVDLMLCIGMLNTGTEPQPKDLIVAEALNGLDCPYIYVSSLFSEMSHQTQQTMNACGFKVVMTGIEPTLRALGKVIAWSRSLPMVLQQTAAQPVLRLPQLAEQKTSWSEHRAYELMRAAGIPVIDTTLAQTEDEAVAAATRLGFPVVLKIVSGDIPHKSDVGGVELSIADEAGVRAAYQRILHACARIQPKPSVEGVLVAPMRSGGVELIVGVSSDPQWGQMLVLGLGGIFVEILNDTVLLSLPTSEERIKQALQSLRGARLLEGVRGRPAANLDALAAAVQRIAELAGAFGERLESLEVNPLFVNGAQVEALDALIIEK